VAGLGGAIRSRVNIGHGFTLRVPRGLLDDFARRLVDGPVVSRNLEVSDAREVAPLVVQVDEVAKDGQIQPVEASDSTSSANISEGFFQSKILRGRSLISAATIAR
jgi:hypothetical protein